MAELYQLDPPRRRWFRLHVPTDAEEAATREQVAEIIDRTALQGARRKHVSQG